MVSKLWALMEITEVPIKKGDIVLYLGASHGVTPEIVASIVGDKGFVFCVEVSPDAMQTLLKVCEKHENMAPLLFDASKPEAYKEKVLKADVVYQDITQKNQVEILKRNIALFLKPEGHFILIVKTQSIDAVRLPSEVIEDVKKELSCFSIESVIDLGKSHAKHYAVIGKSCQ